jgi:hypothetical protein
MTRLLAILLVGAVLSGCTSTTTFGQCIGIDEPGKPGLVYKLSVLNTVIGLIFIETIIVPIVVLKDQTYCPIGETTK